ncbi:MAG: GNAT family N-acetyltransferase [Anaerolineales bacterium]|nr:GNAT family N-acetyltransferase [Anaerolineales bacterium]
MTAFSLRPLPAADGAFPYQVYASTRLEEMSLVDWPPEQKEAFLSMQFNLRARQYQAAYPGALTEMILCGELPAGAMITLKKADEILLVDMALLPEFRGSGIGTAVLRDLQKEGKKITLHVLRHNPADRLYSRLGFRIVAEDSMYLTMEWTPR